MQVQLLVLNLFDVEYLLNFSLALLGNVKFLYKIIDTLKYDVNYWNA